MPKFRSALVFSDNTTQSSAVTNLDSLTDVVVTSPSNGQGLIYNGTNWVNSASGGGGSSTGGDLYLWSIYT